MIETIRNDTTKAIQQLRIMSIYHEDAKFRLTAGHLLYGLIGTSDIIDQYCEVYRGKKKLLSRKIIRKHMGDLGELFHQATQLFELDAKRLNTTF